MRLPRPRASARDGLVGHWLAGVLVAGCGGTVAPTAPISPLAEDARNVLIFVVDTLRPDHLGTYGYERRTSPELDAFARESVVFEQAYSVSPWTRTSVVSLFTALHPVAHSCQDKEDVAADELVTMAEIFRDHGYRTGGFSANVSVSEQFNMTQGFESFVYFQPDGWSPANRVRRHPGYVPIDGMMPVVEEWLDGVGEEPFFLYVHCLDPHFPYAPPRRFERFGDGRDEDRYDGEILSVDFHFGRLIDRLREDGVLDETLVVFTSDHGEEWGEHGAGGHGHSLYDELLRVPLILRHPELSSGRREGVVRLVDLLPTLIELCDLELPGVRLQGHSFAASLLGGDMKSEAVLAEIKYATKIDAFSLSTDGWKLIHTEQDARGKRNAWELYHTAVDADERENLAMRERERVREMTEELTRLRRKYAKDRVEGSRINLEGETLDALRELGYVR